MKQVSAAHPPAGSGLGPAGNRRRQYQVWVSRYWRCDYVLT